MTNTMTKHTTPLTNAQLADALRAAGCSNIHTRADGVEGEPRNRIRSDCDYTSAHDRDEAYSPLIDKLCARGINSAQIDIDEKGFVTVYRTWHVWS